MEKINIRMLVEWLGADGARAGLNVSSILTLNELRKIAISCGVRFQATSTRDEIIELLISKYAGLGETEDGAKNITGTDEVGFTRLRPKNFFMSY